MYTLYGKPFTNNQGLGCLPADIVPAAFRKEHDVAMNLRHELYAHSDIGPDTSLKTPEGEILLKAHMLKTPLECKFGHAIIIPYGAGLVNFQNLVVAVVEQIVNRMQSAVAQHLDEMRALSEGRYEVDLTSEDDVPVFKAIKA